MKISEFIGKIASDMSRVAIGFPTEQAYKKYMKKHPKADPENHWVETNPESPSVSPIKPKPYHKVPITIGRGKEKIDMTKSVLRSNLPDSEGNYKWYDYNGRPVSDPDTILRIDRLSRELSLAGETLKNVRIFTDYRPGSSKPFAMCYNDKWEKRSSEAPFKYFYTEIQARDSNRRIMEKNIKFSKAFKEKRDGIMKDAEKGITEAVIIKMTELHYVRIGTKGQKNDGICTLRAKYCTVEDDKIRITKMPTKSNKKFSCTIKDPVLVQEMKKRLQDKTGDDIVFDDTDANKVNNYLKDVLGDSSFSVKNMRTRAATAIAFECVAEKTTRLKDGARVPKKNMTLADRYAIMAEACVRASKALHNEPAVCHSNYIDHRAFEVLNLPDDDYHKKNPVARIEPDGTIVFKTEAQIEKLEQKLREGLDDDNVTLWDEYAKERDKYLAWLNIDRAKDGWEQPVDKLPFIHAANLIKKYLVKKQGKTQ